MDDPSGSSSTDMDIVGENLLRAFCKLRYLQLCDSSDHCKNSVANVLPSVEEIFLHKNNRDYNNNRSYPFFSFLRNQIQESNFQ